MEKRDYGFLLLGLTTISLLTSIMLKRGFLTPHKLLVEWSSYMASNFNIIITIGILIYSIYLIKSKK